VTLQSVRNIADAVLYEGYILYPYRASAQKNRSRWQFGVIMSPGYAAAEESEASSTRAECVMEYTGPPAVRVILRFLQVQRRTSQAPIAGSWDEAVEREIEVSADSAALSGGGVRQEFTVEGGEDRDGDTVRRREPLSGVVSVRAAEVPGPWRAVRLQVRIENRTDAGPPPRCREDALPTALVAAHAIITVDGGKFVSMTDPPEWAQPAVAQCRNEGGWPVLVEDRAVLFSPIILPDHPEVAAESPGELYDGTEIDEILTLRTLALSGEEKAETRATDPRAAALLDRVESMDAESMARLHGTMRVEGPAESPAPWWDPDADASVSPDTDSVMIGGRPIARGSLVRLRPGARRADAQDMFLVGRIAEVQAVLHDVEDNPYLAVSLAGQPDEDLRIAHGRFLYFTTDEVEPCEDRT
jgi:hypothetical protein